MERTGRCLCGQVTFRVTGDPVTSRVCWCRDCQHIAGNGTVNAIFPASAVSIEGRLAEFRKIADSGNELRRRFCPDCGCHLFAVSSARPQLMVLRLGTLDDPSSIRPSVNIWTASAPAWACMDPDLEHVERQPAPAGPPPTPT